MRSYRQYVSVITCVLVLTAAVLPSLLPAEKASALFTTSIENRSPLSTDNVTHKTRPPKPEHFPGLASSTSENISMEGLSGLDPALLAGKNEKPEIHTTSYGSLEFVYVNAATGNDSYDGSSPVVLPGGIGPKKTIQAGIDAADYYCVVFVAAGVYHENIVITDYYMDLIGDGARTTIIDGGGSGQVMYIDECDIWIEGFTIRNGYSSAIGGGVQIEDSEVYFEACAIKDNYALGGGGVFNWYSATIFYECAVTNNSAFQLGGGIANVEGVIGMVNSTVSNNTAMGSDWGGGGIYSYGSGMWLGGIELYGTTLAHNSAPAAGASGGGYYNHQYSVSFFESCIVANNMAGTPGTNNAFTNGLSFSDGYNIDSENTCGFDDPTDQVNTDPKLGMLKDNGGPTDTHAITADSPAFEKGYTGNNLGWYAYMDQRGVTRPQGAYCDVGAYELEMIRMVLAAAANYGGQVNFSASDGGIVDMVVTSKCPGSGSWSGATFPYGFFSFKIVGITPGATVKVTITFPGPIPADYRYMQCDGHGKWTDITSLTSRTNAANTLVLTLTDGGLGDLDHTANRRIVDPAGPCIMPAQRSPSSASASPMHQPVALPAVKVQSASLSSSSVAPGTAVTVSADVTNTGTVNGSMTVKLYINGYEEDSRVIVVEKGAAVPVTFEVTRNEPGTYSVYVGGVNAGSFIVDSFAGPGVILIISSAMLFAAFLVGLIYIYRRRQLL